MKIQDVIFIISVLALLVIRKDRWFLYTGLACFFMAIPLFSTWVFFTAERLTWYGSAFILVFLMVQMFFRPNHIQDSKEV